MDMFDDDDTLMYEPAQTAAIILTGDDEEAEKAALEVNKQQLRGLIWNLADVILDEPLCEDVERSIPSGSQARPVLPV